MKTHHFWWYRTLSFTLSAELNLVLFEKHPNFLFFIYRCTFIHDTVIINRYRLCTDCFCLFLCCSLVDADPQTGRLRGNVTLSSAAARVRTSWCCHTGRRGTIVFPLAAPIQDVLIERHTASSLLQLDVKCSSSCPPCYFNNVSLLGAFWLSFSLQLKFKLFTLLAYTQS